MYRKLHFASNSDILGTKRDIDVNRKKYRRANIALSNTINSISKLLVILKLWSFEFHDSWFFCSYNNMYNSSILSFWNSISIQVPKKKSTRESKQNLNIEYLKNNPNILVQRINAPPLTPSFNSKWLPKLILNNRWSKKLRIKLLG